LETADRSWIDVKRSWRLNERHYGALQGKNKAEVRDEFGEEQFMTWRRSFDTPPPELDDASEWSQALRRWQRSSAQLPCRVRSAAARERCRC
ncbi:2,3-bisphosphoglycerate-dependent phosphoglycerate mutase, partial [Brevibacterium paucivorans]|uniref:2,3-bisphosphoglycerate-dependent phosphoglycerate mutase n=1 Tax=Brevibacterium paucivorans TaxID=170994 RepID=UPI002155D706